MVKGPKRVRVDMHTHSEASPDSRTPIAEEARGVRAAGIDVICATDHNTIDGALRLRELADGFRVIVGEEISSRDGEIIGLFLESAIPREDLVILEIEKTVRGVGKRDIVPTVVEAHRHRHAAR